MNLASDLQRMLSPRFLERWFTLPLAAQQHPQQIGWHLSKAQFNVIAAARRTYKTERFKRKIIHGTPHHKGALTMVNGRFFAAEPTRTQAKAIFWKDLKTMTRPFWQGAPSETDLVIRLKTGSEIHVIGTDKPERMEGMMWHGGGLDEIANMKAGIFEEHIAPVAADTGAWIDILGVPDYAGQNAKEHRKLYEQGIQGEFDDWRSWSWIAADILPWEVIEKFRRTLSPAAFRQEFEASWEAAPGRAYNEWVTNLDVVRQGVPFIDGDPVHVWVDVNYSHHVWGLGQVEVHPLDAERLRYRIFKELYRQSATVEVMCRDLRKMLPERYFERDDLLHFYGDYSGTQRRAEATRSAWGTIKDSFPSAGYHYRRNPPISDRLHRTNAGFCNARGERSTIVDPSCERHIDDFENVTVPMLYGENKTGVLTHASDGYGYFLNQYDRALEYEFVPKPTKR